MSGGSSKHFLVRVAAEKLEFGLSRLCSAGSRSVAPISHSSWISGHLRLVLLMVKCRSTGGQVQPCKHISNLFKSCPLIHWKVSQPRLKSRAEFNSPPTMRPKQVTWTRPRLIGQGCLPLPGRWRESVEQSSDLQVKARVRRDSALRSG